MEVMGEVGELRVVGRYDGDVGGVDAGGDEGADVCEDEVGFRGVGVGGCEEMGWGGGFGGCWGGGGGGIVVVIIIVIGGVDFGEIATLGVVEDEGFAGVVCVFYGVGEGGEEAVCDAGGGDEGGRVHVVGGETHDLFVHAVLDFEHALYAGAMEGEEAVEEGDFQGWGGFSGWYVCLGLGFRCCGFDRWWELEVVAC